jgi:hypothetical protein
MIRQARSQRAASRALLQGVISQTTEPSRLLFISVLHTEIEQCNLSVTSDVYRFIMGIFAAFVYLIYFIYKLIGTHVEPWLS